jgi:hypothetical protein
VATKCHRVTTGLRKRTDKARVVHLAHLYCSYLGSKLERMPRSALCYRMYHAASPSEQTIPLDYNPLVMHVLLNKQYKAVGARFAFLYVSDIGAHLRCVSNVSPVNRTLNIRNTPEHQNAAVRPTNPPISPVPFTITRFRPTSTLNLSRKT